MEALSSAGLVLFVVVVAVSVGVLLVDWLLYAIGRTTITRYCLLYPVLGWVVVAWPILGAIGLAVHLLCYSSS